MEDAELELTAQGMFEKVELYKEVGRLVPVIVTVYPLTEKLVIREEGDT
jgi:hypothetical protein